MKKALALASAILIAAPAWAAPMDAKTVRLFLTACVKQADACNTALSERVTAEADADPGKDVCITDDMRDAPIMISRAMMRYLKETKGLAAQPLIKVLDAGAKILYPCNP